MRIDETALAALGLSTAERKAMGLAVPADAPPDRLVDVYLRRSAKNEDMLTLKGHLRDICRWVAAEGMQVRRVWLEQRSASKRGVRRDEFEAACSAVLAGESKTLAAWRTDRLDRRGMGAVGALLDKLEARRARLVSVTEGLDSSRGGRIMFAFLSEKARDEAAAIADRVASGHESHRQAGRRGTGRPVYGLYSKKGSGVVEPHWDEAPIARKMVDWALEGHGSAAIAERMNGAGHTTRAGNPWSASSIAHWLKSPMSAGMIPRNDRVTDEYGAPTDRWRPTGEPLIGGDGAPMMCGTGVMSVAEWYRIRERARERTAGGSLRRGKRAPRYLGTGIYGCGRCGGPAIHGGGAYSCRSRQARGSSVCLGFRLQAAIADAHMGRVWASHVAALDPGDPVLVGVARAWGALTEPGRHEDHQQAIRMLAAAQERVQRLEADYYIHGTLGEERYGELARAQQGAIRQLAARVRDSSPVVDITAILEAPRQVWEAADLASRRALLRGAVSARGVEISPDPGPVESRMVPHWATEV